MKNYESLFSKPGHKPSYKPCGCDSVKGNSIGVELNSGDCEVRADVVVARTNGVRIWGRVKDCDGRSVSYALVKLVKVVNNCGMIDVEGIAHTITDCNGFYQFEVDCCDPGTKYRVLVHKASSGGERRIPESEMECDPCSTQQPCHPPVPPCPPPIPPCPPPIPPCPSHRPPYDNQCGCNN